MIRIQNLVSSVGVLLAIVFLPLPLGCDAQDAVRGDAKVGINLAAPDDWNTEVPFVDVFRLSRPWISQRRGESWGKGPALDLDENGWVKRLEPGCYAETLMCTSLTGHVIAGRYTILYEGTGELRVRKALDVVDAGPGRMVVRVGPEDASIFLQLRETDPRDYVRNIRVILPGYEKTWEDQVFNPTFLSRWRGFACFRFMDFMETNHSKIRSWGDRPRVEHATWCKKGIPVEIMCDLANRTRIAPWFCMPHQADDEFVRRFAELVEKRLDRKLKVYVEYSNEVWNGQFDQHEYAAKRGKELGLGRRTKERALRFHGRRSREIFEIWERVFGGTKRLVRVVGSHAASPWATRQILETTKVHEKADALAIAPYMSLRVKTEDAAVVKKAGLEGILDRLETESLPRAIQNMKNQKEIADAFGLELICYEAGQHLVGLGRASRDEEITKLLTAANRSERMGTAYTRYLDAWAEVGGGVIAMFSSVAKWGRYGSWGLLEYHDQQASDSPKFRATLAWAKKRGQDVRSR